MSHDAADRLRSPEHLGPGGIPYRMMYEEPDAAVLERLVAVSAQTSYGRAEEILAVDEHQLLAAAHADA